MKNTLAFDTTIFLEQRLAELIATNGCTSIASNRIERIEWIIENNKDLKRNKNIQLKDLARTYTSTAKSKF